ncbi:MAG: hypothetical protein GY874_21385 [Desulfobacteraceae bacterium]|nr:hypothetical protein [Desulfobacteraceae bacterium]
MTSSKATYKKLPGRCFSLFGVKRLWQGSNHLLWVETVMTREHYKRFYYKDIQAIIIEQTSHHHYWNLLWGILILIFLIAALSASAPPYISGFLTFFYVVCLTVNLLFGPTCNVYLQTAVQLQKVSFGRLTKALLVANRLKTIIETEQGRLDVSNSPHAARKDRKPDPLVQKPEKTKPVFPIFHTLAFSAFVATGFSRIVQVGAGWIAMGFADLFSIIICMILPIIALVRGSSHVQYRRPLGICTWAGLIVSFLYGFINYIFFIVTPIQNPGLSTNPRQLLMTLINTFINGHPGAMVIQIGTGAACIIVGCVGLLVCAKTIKSNNS